MNATLWHIEATIQCTCISMYALAAIVPRTIHTLASMVTRLTRTLIDIDVTQHAGVTMATVARECPDAIFARGTVVTRGGRTVIYVIGARGTCER